MASTASAISLIVAVLVSLSADSVRGASHHHHAAPAPAPSAECSSLIMNMADCLSFVSTGSTVTKPEGTCCKGLGTVLKSNAQCLCEGLKSSASMGITLNVTKALSLPAACKLHAPSITNCGLAAPPAGAPGLSPTAAAAGPESAGANAPTPAPSPGNFASSLFPISVASVVSVISVMLFSLL